MMNWKACIFDLDGVIVHTSQYHYLAWRRLATELGYSLSENDNDALKGLSRLESLNQIAIMAGVELVDKKKAELMKAKNEWYLESVKDLKPTAALIGVRDFIVELRDQHIKVALGSASKNAELILQLLEMSSLFDATIDGTHTTKSKPDPQVFLLGAEALNCQPGECVVFEDSIAGIQAANTGGFYSIGVGSTVELHEANTIISGFENFTVDSIKAIIK